MIKKSNKSGVLFGSVYVVDPDFELYQFYVYFAFKSPPILKLSLRELISVM